MKTKFISILILTFLIHTLSFAQEVEMADTFRSNGKIYVVLAVILIIFFGIGFYLYSIDKKISVLEEEKKNNF